jgi:hypothetical protein
MKGKMQADNGAIFQSTAASHEQPKTGVLIDQGEILFSVKRWELSSLQSSAVTLTLPVSLKIIDAVSIDAINKFLSVVLVISVMF